MGHFLVGVVEPLFESGWIYPISMLFCALDAFLPVIPSETVVITSGVFASMGKLSPVLVVAASAVGAFAGDSVSYLIGRYLGRRFERWLSRSPKRRRAHDWARRALEREGGVILIVARFVPGGRTATTLTAGAVGYPYARFAGFVAIAAVAWALYATGLGYLGGEAFAHHPLEALVLGLGVSLVVSGVVELSRRLIARRRRARTRARARARAAASRGRTPVPALDSTQPAELDSLD